ncbi:GntR family transcriptional regulator [Streptomyces filamentosus]|uniref:GntR family transcriptional regulator n=1 Tax=Streptomyces filamentosus TaxID=67294 RepID=UPI00331924F3
MSGYADIAAHYRGVILSGEMKPGDAMPSYAQAVETHGVNRTTIVRAYDVLKSEGLIMSQPGKGTVVAKNSVVITGAARVERMARNGLQYAHGETSTGHQVMRRSVADPDVCQALELEPGEEVVIRIRTFRQDGKPTSVGVSVYPPRTTDVVPELLADGQMQAGFFGNLYTDRTGRDVMKGQQLAYGRMASQDEITALELDTPVYRAEVVTVVISTFHDETGPLAYWEDVYAPGLKVPVGGVPPATSAVPASEPATN